jgi:hypothetical protein
MQASVTSRSFRRPPVFAPAFALAAALACDETTPTETLAGSDGPAAGAPDEGPGMTPVDASALLIDLPVNQAVSTAAPTPAFRINQFGTAGGTSVRRYAAAGNALMNGRTPASKKEEIDRVSLERLFAAVTQRYVACDGTVVNGD